MIETLIRALLLPLAIHGLATWYGPPANLGGDTMANGGPLRLAAPTVAVDVSRRDLLGRRAVVLTGCGRLRFVEVTDTGRLAAAGPARFGVGPLGSAHYWPADKAGVRWADGPELWFVADFPRDYFAGRVACGVDAWGRGETTEVWVWFFSE